MLDISPLATDCNHQDRPDDGGAVELPAGLDPQEFPIIAAHFYNWRSVGAVAAQVVQDLAFRRKIKRFVAKGDRVVTEMLAELAAERNLATVIDELLDRYLAIPDKALDIANGRDFAPPPLHEVLSDISEV